MRRQIDDWNDGVDDNGGVPRTAKKAWLDINWAFPPNAPNPLHFTVVAFTGTDPTDTTKYLFQPMAVLPTDRRLVIAISPNANVTGINAAVRADYA
jgi:hypothetical protein